jgi:hypothetical protein
MAQIRRDPILDPLTPLDGTQDVNANLSVSGELIVTSGLDMEGDLTLASEDIAGNGEVKDSYSLLLNANYDADPAAGITPTDWIAQYQHVMLTPGTDPTSKLVWTIGGETEMELARGTANPSQLGSLNVGTYLHNGQDFFNGARVTCDNNNTLELLGKKADSASAVAVRIKSNFDLSTPGAKLLSVFNQNEERFYIGHDGQVKIIPDSSGSLTNGILQLNATNNGQPYIVFSRSNWYQNSYFQFRNPGSFATTFEWEWNQNLQWTSVEPVTFSNSEVGANVASDAVAFKIAPQISQNAGTPNYTALLLDVTEAIAPGSDNRLLDLQVDGNSKFRVSNTGEVTMTSATVKTTGVDFSKGLAVNRTEISTTYNILSTDHIVGVSNTSSPRLVVLPDVSSSDIDTGKQYVIKDESGAAGGNNITVSGQAGQLIDGVDAVTISSNYGSVKVYGVNGPTVTGWFIY